MSRDFRVYLDDIEEAIDRIHRYTSGLSFLDFSSSELRVDAVIRNLEIIGEAVKKLPDSVKTEFDEIEWKKIAGLRDILIHEYFGVDLEIIWDVLQNHLPDLKN